MCPRPEKESILFSAPCVVERNSAFNRALKRLNPVKKRVV